MIIKREILLNYIHNHHEYDTFGGKREKVNASSDRNSMNSVSI